MQSFQSLTVQDIIRENANAVSVIFELPDTLKNSFSFKAGQYLTLKKTIDGKEVRRSYSLCSTPSSGQLKVLIKKVPDGIFSSFANGQLSVGDSLEVHPPEGRFIFEPNATKTTNYAAFAAGSGITPIISIIKTGLKEQPESKFLLVYGNKSVADAIFIEELIALQGEYSDRFMLELVLSRQEQENARFGRIDSSIINYFIGNKYASLSFDEFYVCGPGEMIDTTQEALVNKGVSSDVIHFERFTAEPDSATDSAAIKEGFVQIKFTIDDSEHTITAPIKESVLDVAIKNDLDPPHSCQGGICSSCIARITKGTVEMRKNQILTDSEVEEGLILTCQSHATSPEIEVDYDDV
ncbi:MAG: ferredoxin--NADP reductase [Gilvibacter sp.]